VPYAGIFGTRSRSAMLKCSSPSAVWRPITRQSGVGPSVTIPSWNSGGAIISSRPTNPQVKGFYLYRAIDSTGATIDSLLSALHDAAAAKRLIR
jgi:hypothetical protein